MKVPKREPWCRRATASPLSDLLNALTCTARPVSSLEAGRVPFLANLNGNNSKKTQPNRERLGCGTFHSVECSEGEETA
ncbi:hypothetical protein GCM10027578_06450 [Spirosoma luteolum]